MDIFAGAEATKWELRHFNRFQDNLLTPIGGVVWDGVFKGVQNNTPPSAVGVFPAQATVVEYHLSTIDVIAKSPSAQRKAVLAFSLSDAFQFSDAMLPAPVVWISAKKSQSIHIGCRKLSVASGKGAEESVKARSGADRKRRRHAF